MSTRTLPASSIPPAGTAPATTRPRAGGALLLAGVVLTAVVTGQHPSREAPNDHRAAFAEYAADPHWIAVHLAQFATGLVALAGLLVLLAGLRSAGARPLLVQVAQVAVGIAGALLAVLQGIDGITLKHAVDALAAAPDRLQDAAFSDAEVVRWLEWAAAAFFRLTFGLAVGAVGVAVLSARAAQRWTGALAVVAGSAFVVDGVGVGAHGFAGATAANLVSWGALALFALLAAVAPPQPRAALR